MSTPLPPAPVTSESLLAFLDSQGFETKTAQHPPLFTVEDSKELRGTLEGGHTKNLFLKDKKSRYFLLTAQEDTDIDLKSLHKLMGAQGRFSFGKPDKLEAYLGVLPGAVTALGVINDRNHDVTFAIDQRLLEHDKINCHPLVNTATTTLRTDDLFSFARLCGHDPMIVDLAQTV
ncbi:MAG: prolyl-tRNA synthetase associated domain-containing protein [Ahrensia sp.]|nr:prolyl-tRNA synthetase associated domain-containing protein [Ahrensia sp.]